MALGQLDGVAIGVLDPGNVIFASGPVGSRLVGPIFEFSVAEPKKEILSLFRAMKRDLPQRVGNRIRLLSKESIGKCATYCVTRFNPSVTAVAPISASSK